jgi:hypothetical protein
MSNNSIPEPSRSIILLNQTQNKLTLESRFLSRTESAPFFSMGRMRITCTCSATDADCKKKLLEASDAGKAQQQRRSCPAGSLYSGSETGQKVSAFDFNGSMIRIYSQPVIPSLLQPNHFYKILEGACKGKSAAYQECAAHAYNSPNPTCNVSEKCFDDTYYLGSQQ